MTSISVVIPTYGRGPVLVDTVSALLALSDRGDELILIDQTESRDPATAAYLDQAQSRSDFRWLRHAPPGIVGAMNRGLAEARGDIVLFLDDDIVPEADLVAAHRRAFDRHPEAWAVVGRVLQPEDAADHADPPRGAAERLRPPRFASALHRDLDFRFNGVAPGWVENVIACNLAVRRDRALAVGGFDANFIPPVSYRFETEFAKRLVAVGGRIRFEPGAAIRHLRAVRGGTRSIGSHLASASPLHGVGDYYYALRCGRGWERIGYMARRPFREVLTRFHLRHPWWIPVKFFGELRAIW